MNPDYLTESTLALLKQTPLFSGLTTEHIQTLLQCNGAYIKKNLKDSYLLEAGNHTEHMAIILSGSALIIQEDLWGNRSIISHLDTGSSYGEAFACVKSVPLNISVLAKEDTTILLLHMQKLLSTCSNACSFHQQMIANLVQILSTKMLSMNQKITHMSMRSIKDKLLSYLSYEAQRQQALTFDIPFDRQALADYLCVERAAMSVVLSELKKEGLIDYKKNHFTLLVTDTLTMSR